MRSNTYNRIPLTAWGSKPITKHSPEPIIQHFTTTTSTTTALLRSNARLTTSPVAIPLYPLNVLFPLHSESGLPPGRPSLRRYSLLNPPGELFQPTGLRRTEGDGRRRRGERREREREREREVKASVGESEVDGEEEKRRER